MANISLKVNNKAYQIEADPQTPLLWVLRDQLGLTGTKFGCGIAQCGACTVHLNGGPIRACMFPVSSVGEDDEVTTIEGLSEDRSHPLQKAWIEEQVPQCGYCQSGQIMQAAALLTNRKNPSREEIVNYMNGVLCRCATYHRIIKAVERASRES